MYTSGRETWLPQVRRIVSILCSYVQIMPLQMSTRSIIDDAITLDGDILFHDHLDGFLCDHASEEDCGIGKVPGC